MRAVVRLLGGNNENVFDSVGKRRLHRVRMRIFESFNHHSHESWAGFPVSTLCLFSWSREMRSLPLSSRLQTIMMSIRVSVNHTSIHSQTHSQSICSHSLRFDTSRPFPFANPSDSSRFSTLLSWNPPSYLRFLRFWSSVCRLFSTQNPKQRADSKHLHEARSATARRIPSKSLIKQEEVEEVKRIYYFLHAIRNESESPSLSSLSTPRFHLFFFHCVTNRQTRTRFARSVFWTSVVRHFHLAGRRENDESQRFWRWKRGNRVI